MGHIALIKEQLQKWITVNAHMNTNSLHSLESIHSKGKEYSKDKMNGKESSDLHCIIHNYIADTFIQSDMP